MKNRLKKRRFRKSSFIKPLSIAFEQDKKCPTWIRLLINSRKGEHRISISAVFPPFKDLTNFLSDIIKKKSPNLEIDEEGKVVKFVAKNLSKNNSCFHFILRNALRPKEVYIEGNYSRKEFVKEFVTKLKEFLDNKFDEKGWMEISTEKMPYEKIKQLIKTLDEDKART